MSKRLTGVLALSLLLLFAVLAVPATAVEEGGEAPQESGPAPGIDEIGTQNEVSGEFLPEPAEEPPFMKWLYFALAAVAVLALIAVTLLYLVWQPRFATERRSKRRR